MSINTIKIPTYLQDDFNRFLDNIFSYIDLDDQDMLPNYLNELLNELKEDKSIFVLIVDQLAMAILLAINIESKELSVMVDLEDIPTLEDIRPYVKVNKNHRQVIDELINEYPEELVRAILLIHLYNINE